MKVLRSGPYVNFKNIMMNKLVSGGELWAPNIITIIKTNGISMIFIFANVWFFDDIFNLYEFQEKQNIAC